MNELTYGVRNNGKIERLRKMQFTWIAGNAVYNEFALKMEFKSVLPDFESAKRESDAIKSRQLAAVD